MALVGPLMSCFDESNRDADGRHDDGGIQAVLGSDAGGQTVGHRLRHGQGGHG